MVVITIIGILSSVIYANFGDAGAQSRDAKRQADLRNLQTAIELYRLDNGIYPSGCNATSTWSGQIGTTYVCGNGTGQYIASLAPKYIRTLPTDSKNASGDSGYVYTTNVEGSVYKLMAKNTVESEIVDDSHEFRSCDMFNICAVPPPHCEAGTQYDITYAVWGGYASTDALTEDVICDIP